MRGIRTCVQIPIIQDNVINPLREGKNNTCCHTVGRRYIWELIREGFKKEEILALKQAFFRVYSVRNKSGGDSRQSKP